MCVKWPMSQYLCHLWRPEGRQERVDDVALHARTKPLQCYLCSVCQKRTPSWNEPISRRVKVTSSSAITPQAFCTT